MTATENYIEMIKPDAVRALWSNEQLFANAMTQSDLRRIEKLLTIKTLDDYWGQVRKLVRRVTSDYAINAWERLAELRAIQLDLQLNYDRDTLTKKGDQAK